MNKPNLRDIAKQVLDGAPGDSLGLAFDPEAQLDAADVAAERYLRAPSPETLRPWREVVKGLESYFGASELGAEEQRRLGIHRLLLEASERWQAGESSGIDGLRACVSEVSEEEVASDPHRATELIRGLGEFIVSALWGQRAQAV